LKTTLKLAFVLAVVVAALFGAWKIYYVMENGELYERHIVPGKPTIEIRIYGLADAGFDACMIEGWKRSKIFDSLECYPPNFQGTTNPIVRNYQGTCVRTRERLPIFQVLWLDDSQRVGIAFDGYFVAAYDRNTGKRVEFADYVKFMNVRDRNGAALWHDYKRCDTDIARFLRSRTVNLTN
jgi:hypothetical protein